MTARARTLLLAALGVAGGAALFAVTRAGDGDARGAPAPSAAVAGTPTSLPAGVAVPAGMVYVPEGTTRVGAWDGKADEQPVFEVRVRPFLMDAHPVTVAEFRRFVEATGHRTSAERAGDGAVWDAATDEWRLVRGASWHHPLGPDAPPASDDHPVTQVSWHDAAAYARWAGKRLPTEVEWEHAARGGVNARGPYAWGTALAGADGRARANTWEAHDAGHDADGHVHTSPVGTYGRTPLGLADMGGNVWEWTADWYRPYEQRDRAFTPDSASARAQRGGSFLCTRRFCHGYRVSARSFATPETASFHTGFRLVQDLSVQDLSVQDLPAGAP